MLDINQAVEYCQSQGQPVSKRGLRKACARGYIPDARKIGRDWVITLEGLKYYLSHRPKRGRKPKDKSQELSADE